MKGSVGDRATLGCHVSVTVPRWAGIQPQGGKAWISVDNNTSGVVCPKREEGSPSASRFQRSLVDRDTLGKPCR